MKTKPTQIKGLTPQEYQLNYVAEKRKKGLCRKCTEKATQGTPYCDYHRDRYRFYSVQQIAKARELVYSHYGNRCSCCGETERLFLSIDHVNEDGNKQRSETNIQGGLLLFKWIIKNKYPKTIQILCMNCNLGKHRNHGICPHKTSPKNKNK